MLFSFAPTMVDRNGKSMMKLVRFSILRPLLLKRDIFNMVVWKLEILKELYG